MEKEIETLKNLTIEDLKELLDVLIKTLIKVEGIYLGLYDTNFNGQQLLDEFDVLDSTLVKIEIVNKIISEKELQTNFIKLEKISRHREVIGGIYSKRYDTIEDFYCKSNDIKRVESVSFNGSIIKYKIIFNYVLDTLIKIDGTEIEINHIYTCELPDFLKDLGC